MSDNSHKGGACETEYFPASWEHSVPDGVELPRMIHVYIYLTHTVWMANVAAKP